METLKFGLNVKARHDPTCNGLDIGAVAPSVLFAVPEKLIGLQLVGLNMNPGRSITALIERISAGIPFDDHRQRGRRDRQLRGMPIHFDLRPHDIVPRLNGPATIGTTIDRPNGAPS